MQAGTARTWRDYVMSRMLRHEWMFRTSDALLREIQAKFGDMDKQTTMSLKICTMMQEDKPVDEHVQETADRKTKEAGRDGQDRAVTLKGRDHKRLRAFAGRAKSRTAASVRADRTEIAAPISTDRGR